MKKNTFALYYLLTASALFSMEKKTISLANYNNGELRIEFEHFTAQGQSLGSSYEQKNNLKTGEHKSYQLMAREKDHIIVNTPILIIPEIDPQLVTLIVGDEGKLRYGDELTISQNKTTVFITNTRGDYKSEFMRTDMPYVIGISPTYEILPSTLFRHTLNFSNQSNFNVTVLHAALSRLCNDPRNLPYQDAIIKECSNTLYAGSSNTEINMQTFSSFEAPGMLATITKLIIKGALPEEVIINLDNETIESGDTIVISDSTENSTMLDISKITASDNDKKLIAQLYTQFSQVNATPGI